jgi:enoyl-CoA hydratase/carnithine racemase
VSAPSYHKEFRFSIKEVDVGIVAGAPLQESQIGESFLLICVYIVCRSRNRSTHAARCCKQILVHRNDVHRLLLLQSFPEYEFIFFLFLQKHLPFTGRRFDSAEARANGLLSSVHPTPASAFSHSMHLATLISKKSPLVIRGIKEHIRFSDEHSASEGLEHAAIWNSGMLSASDIGACMSAGKQGIPTFSKL